MAIKTEKEYLLILNGKVLLLKLKHKIYTSCNTWQRTWPMKEHGVNFNRTEADMLRWMCGFELKERIINAEIRKFLGLEPVS